MNAPFSLVPGFHAVVVGGAGNIGAAIARQFCDLGATVTAPGVDDADIAPTRLEPRAGLELASPNVTDDSAVAAFASRHTRVDALVNCAGTLARDRRHTMRQGTVVAIDGGFLAG